MSPTPSPTGSFPESRTYLQLGNALMGEGDNDLAGFSVSLSANGRYAAVGARRNAEDGKKNRGSVRIFKFNGEEFVMVAEIDGGRKGDQFGYSCSLSGDGKKIAIGAPGADAGGKNSGEVIMYEERFGQWAQTGTLSGEEKQDLFGLSVSLDEEGESLAVGAPYDSVGDSSYAGAVYVYGMESGGSWYSLGPRMEGIATRQLFGWSVSISSSTSNSLRVAIGSPHYEKLEQRVMVSLKSMSTKPCLTTGNLLANKSNAKSKWIDLDSRFRFPPTVSVWRLVLSATIRTVPSAE